MNGLDGFTHRHAEVNDTRLHYVVGGQGPAVVLLHGFPYSWEAWRAVMPRLAETGYAVLAPDLRGMGDSAPAASDTFAKTDVSEDVCAVLQSLGLGPIHLVGADIGAMVAYAYASRHPGEVARLVLAESLLRAQRHHLHHADTGDAGVQPRPDVAERERARDLDRQDLGWNTGGPRNSTRPC